MRALLITVLLVSALLSGCGGEEESPRAAAPAASATATPEPAETPAAATAGRFGAPVVVPSTANVFGAGQEEPPGPAGGGPGDLPVELALPEGARTVRVTAANGKVTPLSDGEGSFAAAGAEGSKSDTWRMPAAAGISGIGHQNRRMFLTGVFLSGDAPSSKPPKAIAYGRKVPARQSPEIAQTFLLGGRQARTFRVPRGATRLFLGFADFKTYASERGAGDYTNNRGELTVTLEAS